MTNDRRTEATLQASAPVKTCRWCGGPLVFDPHFPMLRLLPGEPQACPGEHVPHALRTVPAWVCGTPFCKYREKA